jgi:hypothetical protein
MTKEITNEGLSYHKKLLKGLLLYLSYLTSRKSDTWIFCSFFCQMPNQHLFFYVSIGKDYFVQHTQLQKVIDTSFLSISQAVSVCQ